MCKGFIYYPVVVQHEGKAYKAYFPDIKDIKSSGKNLEELLKNLKEELGNYLVDLENNKKEFPKSALPNEVKINEEDFMFYVDLNLKIFKQKLNYKSTTKAVTLPGYLNAKAVESGINVSAVLQETLSKILMEKDK